MKNKTDAMTGPRARGLVANPQNLSRRAMLLGLALAPLSMRSMAQTPVTKWVPDPTNRSTMIPEAAREAAIAAIRNGK